MNIQGRVERERGVNKTKITDTPSKIVENNILDPLELASLGQI